MPRTIVLGYDATDGAQAALEKAIELAQLIQARIVIVFGYEIPAAYGGETGEYRRAVRAIAETAVADAAKRIQQAGLDCDSELVPTRPAEGLVSVAEQAGASMIV